MASTSAPARLHHNVTLAILALGCSAYSLQQTMVIPALPVLQHQLRTSTTWVTWVVTVYLLAGAVATPILGKLGDQYGKERLLVFALALLLFGCVGSACAWNVESLIAFRGLTGVGGGVFPLSFAIIRDEFPPERVGVGMGFLSALLGVGGSFGFVIAGVIIDGLNWRWLFVVGAVITAVALMLVHRYVPESPIKTPAKVDLWGAGLLSLGLVALLIALTEGESWSWGSPRIIGLSALSLFALVTLGVVETRVREPLIDMRMLARRPILFTNVTALVAGFAMFGAFVLIPNFVESPRGLPAATAHLVRYGFGASATRAGLYLLPCSLAILFAAPLAGSLGARGGFRRLLVLGLVFVAASAAAVAAWHAHPWEIWVSDALLGVGIGYSYAAMATLIAVNVRAEEMGAATGVNTVIRLVGAVIGGQVGAALLATYTLAGTRGVPSISGFEATFAAAAAAALVGAVLACFVSEPKRALRALTSPGGLDSG